MNPVGKDLQHSCLETTDDPGAERRFDGRIQLSFKICIFCSFEEIAYFIWIPLRDAFKIAHLLISVAFDVAPKAVSTVHSCLRSLKRWWNSYVVSVVLRKHAFLELLKPHSSTVPVGVASHRCSLWAPNSHDCALLLSA